MSEDAPETNDLPLKTLVSSNFREFVDDAVDNDVVVYFWRPNCQKCQKLFPIWERIADDLAQVDNLTIARFNGQLNEMPELKINGYPAIMMMQRGKRGKVINYDSNEFDYRSL